MMTWSLKVTAQVAAVFALFPAFPAQAWDQHQVIMQSIGRTTANLNRRYLYEMVSVPTEADERKMIHSISQGLELNEPAVPIYNQKHPDQKEVVVYELFRGEIIDEPDLGMDQDLPDSADPENERPWMGGKTGLSSQGFRHMQFAGFDYKQPLQTLQYPFHSIGKATVRYQKLLALSDNFFKEGQKFWGIRTLLWALHYLQDLHQPFHVLQIPYWKYLPLSDLFNGFVAKTTHSIANYHFAYEGIAQAYLVHYEAMNFRDCLEIETPRLSENLSEIIEKSRDEGRNIAIPLYDLLGPSYKGPDIDLLKGVGKPDYYKLLRASADESVSKIREATCRIYQSIAQYTWGQFDRAYNYVPEPSKKRGR